MVRIFEVEFGCMTFADKFGIFKAVNLGMARYAILLRCKHVELNVEPVCIQHVSKSVTYSDETKNGADSFYEALNEFQ
jgi:hypothetical protein